jgi:hypothetical protein
MTQSHKHQKSKFYKIHDNGSKPYLVEITGKKVSVFKNMNTFEKVGGKYIEKSFPPKHLFDVTANEIFIGKKSKTGGYSGLTPKSAIGNSILLKINDSKYLYIGHQIYEFKPIKDDDIQKYYSDIGNSDVPYPYAIGKTHIYIMLYKVAIEKSYFDMKKNIYEQFYNKDRLQMSIKTKNGQNKQEIKKQLADITSKTINLKTKQIKN